jgi:hypothetical protein
LPRRIAVAASRLKRFVLVLFPWAYAHGYLLPPLRGSESANPKLTLQVVVGGNITQRVFLN